MKQRVLVVGGVGFIGKRVVKALASTDWADPIAASRHIITTAASSEAAALQLDATEAIQVREALKDAFAVINCVAGSAENIVKSARSLFSAAASVAHAPRIVHLSSMAVYGGAVGEVEECAPMGRQLSAYGAAKAEAERVATAYPSTVILRPGIVYGPHSLQWSERVARLLVARRLGDLGDAGDGYCNLVYIDDMVEAVVRSLRQPDVQGRIFNLSLPEPPTWNEYFVLYAKALGAVPVARITKRSLTIETKVLAPLLKIAEIAADKLMPSVGRALPQRIPPSLMRLFAQEIKMNVAAAEQALELRWTQLDVGLRRTAAWYRTQDGES